MQQKFFASFFFYIFVVVVVESVKLLSVFDRHCLLIDFVNVIRSEYFPVDEFNWK